MEVFPNTDQYENSECLSSSLFEQQAYINVLIQAIVLLLGLSFAIVPVISFTVRERALEADTKFMQVLNRVRPLVYWVGSFIWDTTYYLLVAGVTCICFVNYTQPIEAIEGTVQLYGVIEILLFAITMVCFSYAVSFHFRVHSKAFITLIVFNFATGAGKCR